MAISPGLISVMGYEKSAVLARFFRDKTETGRRL
jgi:hypothetical protein